MNVLQIEPFTLFLVCNLAVQERKWIIMYDPADHHSKLASANATKLANLELLEHNREYGLNGSAKQ